MSRGFIDKVMQFMGFQEEEEAATSDPVATRGNTAQAAPATGSGAATPLRNEPRKSRLVSMPTPSAPGRAGGIRVVVVEPHSFDEVQEIADHLKTHKPVVVSLENLDRELAKRIVDFVSGTTYALDGNLQRVADEIFLFTPKEIPIDFFRSQDAGLPRSLYPWEEE